MSLNYLDLKFHRSGICKRSWATRGWTIQARSRSCWWAKHASTSTGRRSSDWRRPTLALARGRTLWPARWRRREVSSVRSCEPRRRKLKLCKEDSSGSVKIIRSDLVHTCFDAYTWTYINFHTFNFDSNQDAVTEKLALDTEIAVYKRLIDAMDKRLRLDCCQLLWFFKAVLVPEPGSTMKTICILTKHITNKFRGGLLSNGSLNSLIDKEIEEAVEEKKREKVNLFFWTNLLTWQFCFFFFSLFFIFSFFEKSSSSESEGEDDSGIFTKIKEKAADVFDWSNNKHANKLTYKKTNIDALNKQTKSKIKSQVLLNEN